MDTNKKRALFSTIIRHLTDSEAIIITGLRQVGKTTLMRQVYEIWETPKKLWFDFENPLDVKVFEDTDYNAIYRRLEAQAPASSGRLLVCLDEVQNFPAVTKVIKFLIDHYQVKFILTGSSSFYLKNLFPESLAGRKFLFELPPLSFEEFLYFKNAIPALSAERTVRTVVISHSETDHELRRAAYDEYVRWGGFPAVVLASSDEQKKMVLSNLFSSFFEKDLKILSDYQDIRELRDLIILLVPRVGSQLDVTRLSCELGVSRQKIYQFLEFLQGTFFIHLIPRFAKGVDRSVAGGRKVYFADTGILRLIGGASDPQIFENAVVNQFLPYGALSFYNERNRAKIDVIIDKKIAFEIKMTARSEDVKRYQALAQKIGLEQSYLVSRNFTALDNTISPVFI